MFVVLFPRLFPQFLQKSPRFAEDFLANVKGPGSEPGIVLTQRPVRLVHHGLMVV
jgi:hypothetical protein